MGRPICKTSVAVGSGSAGRLISSVGEAGIAEVVDVPGGDWQAACIVSKDKAIRPLRYRRSENFVMINDSKASEIDRITIDTLMGSGSLCF